jgi:ZIP family zinc transporter
MIEAMAWSLLGASSLLLGALLAFTVPIGRRLLGFVMAFGVGVLISAVAYELVEEAVSVSATRFAIAAGFALGALVFYAGDLFIDRRLAAASGAGGGGLAIVLGAVLDGVPESVVIGASLLTGDQASVAVIVAVFLSNIPESISATSDLLHGGWSAGRVLGLWGAVVVTSTLAAGLGYALLKDASGSWVAAIQAFAGGAILTMLADEMLPEAFEYAKRNKSVGLAVAFGFAVAASLSFNS